MINLADPEVLLAALAEMQRRMEDPEAIIDYGPDPFLESLRNKPWYRAEVERYRLLYDNPTTTEQQ